MAAGVSRPDEEVRPRAVGATHEIAAVMSWSYAYTLSVLSRWKMAPVYCQAVLNHPNALRLTVLRPKWWRPGRRIWRPSTLRGARQARAKKAAKSAAPAVGRSKPASASPPAPPPDTPKQLRDLVRASLLHRRV
jgi:hypothetical protein